MKILDAEKNIGIEIFFTSFKGIGGKLRTIPKDFIVKEIPKYPTRKEKGRFTIAEVTTINWETNVLVKKFSKSLHISRKRIGFAGTKDKRAKATRLMSFHNITKDLLDNLEIEDVNIKNIYYSDQPVKIGYLLGNEFEINIRNISISIKLSDIKNIVSIIVNNSGFPNFYGIQRFGIIRPITHIVGKNIVFCDFEKAVMSYIAYPIKGEDERIYKLRDRLKKTYNFSQALNSYPNSLNFEKAMLNKLVNDPKDFVGAIKELPKNLLTMFVYAYQSYIFNKILSERIKRKLPLNKAIVGDAVLQIRRGSIDENVLIITDRNIEKANIQISKGKAFLSGLLLGSDTVFSEGEMGEIEHNIVDSEGIDLRDFIIPDIPFISSSGSRRPLLSPVKNLIYELIDDDLNADRLLLKLKFELNKGCYATSLLREFMKSDNIRNY